MEERAKKLQDIAIYKVLAKEDAEMGDLVKQYLALNGEEYSDG